MKRVWLYVPLIPFLLAPVRLLSLFLKEHKTEIKFVDIGREAGIQAKVRCGGPDKRWIPEANGSGVAWIDYDNDGWLDLLIVNGSDMESLRQTLFGGRPLPQKEGIYLYRNLGDGRSRCHLGSGACQPLLGNWGECSRL